LKPKIHLAFDKEDDLFDRNCYFEGTVNIPNMDDQEEALVVMEEIIDFLEAKSDLTVDDRKELTECREILAGWN